jgi:uncharacterized damage-inducible protein DinB
MPERLMMVGELIDPRRIEPAFVLPERAALDGWLDYHRATLLLKCEGLTDPQRKARPIPSSQLSLHGLIRHMAEVERNWFARALLELDLADAPFIWHQPGSSDDYLGPLDDADWESDLAAWHTECERSRAAAAGKDLDYQGSRNGEPLSLRWIYLHMIEEYARHNGHADLIRELIDGAVGR